jgi:hypothetical protein
MSVRCALITRVIQLEEERAVYDMKCAEYVHFILMTCKEVAATPFFPEIST